MRSSRHVCLIALFVALLAAPVAAQSTQPTTEPTTPADGDTLQLSPSAESPPIPGADVMPQRTSAALRELMLACHDGDLAAAAGRIVYRGDDEARRWQTTYDIEQPAERAEVEGVCRRLSSLNPELGPMQVTNYESETESEGTWHVLSVSISSTGTTPTFAFLELESGLALGDID